MRCIKCVLPEHKPDIWLNADGLCNICADFKRNKELQESAGILLESDLIRTLNRYRGRYKYDCLVMCSGGKDSTASLYYAKSRYKLNPLAFTFDHGFETEDAIENIKNAVDILGVEWLFFKSDFMKEMFAEVIKKKSQAVICHLCSMWYMQLTYEIAANFNIPIIIAGWTKGQATVQTVLTKCACDIGAIEYQSMAGATLDFLDNTLKSMPKYRNFPRRMEEVISLAQKRHKTIVLSPHWFLQKGPEEYVETITKELKWKYPRLSYPKKTTNCYLNFISAYLSAHYYGYTHYHVEMSKMIRLGMLTRQEALGALEMGFDRGLLEAILKKLGCRIEDLPIPKEAEQC